MNKLIIYGILITVIISIILIAIIIGQNSGNKDPTNKDPTNKDPTNKDPDNQIIYIDEMFATHDQFNHDKVNNVISAQISGIGATPLDVQNIFNLINIRDEHFPGLGNSFSYKNISMRDIGVDIGEFITSSDQFNKTLKNLTAESLNTADSESLRKTAKSLKKQLLLDLNLDINRLYFEIALQYLYFEQIYETYNKISSTLPDEFIFNTTREEVNDIMESVRIFAGEEIVATIEDSLR